MAVFNADRYLRQAIESVLAQTYRDFEFLIIDDGSTDRTATILAQYARLDTRIRLISQDNAGLTKTLNRGIDLARGQFLARMDGDDIALPDRFARQINYLHANPDCVLVGSRVLLIDPQGLPIREICQLQTHQEIDSALLNHGWPIVHPAVTMRTDALRAIHGYDQTYRTNQDHDLFLRLAEHGTIANLPEVLLHYRQHPHSVSFANLKTQRNPVEQILQKAYRRRGIQPPVETESISVLDAAHPHRAWAKAALAAGHLATARKHALATLAADPFSYDSWRIMYSSIRRKRKDRDKHRRTEVA
jgi:glycosyltransferase involved in cell wall biosynthesis